MKLFRSLFSAISIITITTLAVNPCYALPFPLQQESSKKKEKVDSLMLKGRIYDRTTSHEIPFAIVEILHSDSTLISAKKIGWKGKNWTRNYDVVEDSSSYYDINIPKVEGNYIIKVSKAGYETKYVPYILSKLHKREITAKSPISI